MITGIKPCRGSPKEKVAQKPKWLAGIVVLVTGLCVYILVN
jgi:hypothetical protein